MAASTLFPVGHYAGLRPDDDGLPLHAIRIGWQQHRLSEDAFGTWVLSHGTPQLGKGSWSADDLVAAALDAGISEPARHAEALATDGLLASASEAFAKAYRLDVQFVGLGNSPENPDQYAVGLPGLGAAAMLDPSSYELWQWGSVAPTLWHMCQVRASIAGDAEPADALTSVLGDLRYLVAHGCAYVDVADPR
ncbi:hypothetical protein OHA70_16010 [Kribbella sp. NBC_00382]|uniref:hypothetical protein n=1 Tax=Kribbella sp. NBC_00382 TaxID=2975967 RepID=UPI002E2035C2